MMSGRPQTLTTPDAGIIDRNDHVEYPSMHLVAIACL